MELTTLCYIEQDGKYLMLHRITKEKDINKDKWIGVGGKPRRLPSTGSKGGDRIGTSFLPVSRNSYLSVK